MSFLFAVMSQRRSRTATAYVLDALCPCRPRSSSAVNLSQDNPAALPTMGDSIWPRYDLLPVVCHHLVAFALLGRESSRFEGRGECH